VKNSWGARIVEEHGLGANDTPLWRASVQEYHRLVDMGFFDEGVGVELLEGYFIEKLAKSPSHVKAKRLLSAWLGRNTPGGLLSIFEDPITLSRSEPEPDGALVRGDVGTFKARHPNSSEVLAVFEVADSALQRDREWKSKIYAEAEIAIYVLLNIPDEVVEVYTEPEASCYKKRAALGMGESIQLPFGSLAASELLG
jgi:hypothetical protein